MAAAHREEEREARVAMAGGPARMKVESGGVSVDLRERETEGGRGRSRNRGGEKIRRCNDCRDGAVQATHGCDSVAGDVGDSGVPWWVREVLGE